MDSVQTNQRDLGTPIGRTTYPETVTTNPNETAEEMTAGASFAESICGLGAVVLAILGLAGMVPLWLLPISIICLGAALFLQGTSIASRLGGIVSAPVPSGLGEMGNGMTAELLGGVAAIALGVLALVHVAPFILEAAAIIVLGGTLIVGSPSTMRINAARAVQTGRAWTTQYVLREAVNGAVGIEVLAGIAGVVLGIIALASGFVTMLGLIAALCMGGAVVLGGAAVGGRMMSLLRRGV